jgi:hypothetical protein
MRFCFLVLMTGWLAGCATPVAPFTNSTFTVDLPPGWHAPSFIETNGVARLELLNEVSKSTWVRIECERYPTPDRPSLDALAARVETSLRMKPASTSRTVGGLVGLKGTGVQRSTTTQDTPAKRLHYAIFLPADDTRLPHCVITMVSTDINAETNVDRVLGSLRLTGK